MEMLYDRFGRPAFGLAYRILGDGPSAEDAVQESFLAVWRQGERLDPARGNVGSLLMTIVRNKALDQLRARRGLATRNLPLDRAAVDMGGPDVVDRVLASIGGEKVRRALESLPEEQRRSIELAYFEGLTHVEIAEALAVPLGTVKSRLRLALERLRSAFGIERKQ